MRLERRARVVEALSFGAMGGATVNLLFMNHFQRVAHGHFTVRRLERHYGAETVRQRYQALADQRLENAT